MAEEEGFEPPRALRRLSVFKTDPFSQTWVLLRADVIQYNIINDKSQHLCIVKAGRNPRFFFFG
jgi:hypothetical protein